MYLMPQSKEPSVRRRTSLPLGGGRGGMFGGRILKYAGSRLIVINHRVPKEAVTVCNFINKGHN